MHVARLPAVGAIVEAVNAEPNIVLRMAKAAVLLASALRLWLLTLRAHG